MSDLIIDGELILYGSVGDFGFTDFFDSAMVLKALSEMDGDITVRLNSGGGIAHEGAAIYAALKRHDGNVTVMVEGVAASAASLLAMAGDEIVMTAGSLMMIHDPAGITIGTADDHQAQADTLNKMSDNYATIYAARSGRDPEDVRSIMKAETWFTADEAVEAGFATRAESLGFDEPTAFKYDLYSNPPAPIMALLDTQSAGVASGVTAAMPAPSNKEPNMAVETKEPAGAVQPDTNAIVAQARAEELTRVREITALAAKMKLPNEKRDALISDGVSLADAKTTMADFVLASYEDEPETVNATPAVVTADARDKFVMGAEKALLAKAGMEGGERNEFASMSLRELARHSIEVTGARVDAKSPMEMVGQAFTMAGGQHSTSDFGSVLANVANKSMLRGYDEVAETFEQWTSAGTLPDFKEAKRVGVTSMGNLPVVEEGAEFTYSTIADFDEAITLATYGQLFHITRQAIINDDLNAFTRIPLRMGRAARRTVGNIAYNVLTANANMGDGTALFASGHNNLAGSGAAPSVATINAGIEAMMQQKDRSASTTALNIMPAYIIAPVSLRSTILQVLESEYDPSKSTRAANTARNVVTPIFDARLTGTAWYLAAAPASADTVEVAYLDGNQAPVLEQRDGWSIDGTEFKVRMEAAAKAMQWEGLYKNPGA